MFSQRLDGKPSRFHRLVYSKPLKKTSYFQRKMLDWTSRKMKKMGVDDEKIVQKFGVEKSFRIAKFASKLDIGTRWANLGIKWSAYSFILVGGGIMMMNALPELRELHAHTPGGITDAQLKAASVQLAFDLSKMLLYWLAPLAVVSKILGVAGNALDVFQHVFLNSVARTFPGGKKEEAEKLYEKFAAVSQAELAVDGAKMVLPLPFTDTLGELWSIKCEKEQLRTIREMEELYKQG